LNGVGCWWGWTLSDRTLTNSPAEFLPSVALNLIRLLILLFIAPEIVRADMNKRDAAVVRFSFPAELRFLRFMFLIGDRLRNPIYMPYRDNIFYRFG